MKDVVSLWSAGKFQCLILIEIGLLCIYNGCHVCPEVGRNIPPWFKPCCQQNFSFVNIWHCHPWRHCPPIGRPAWWSAEWSLGIKRDCAVIQSMIGYWQTFCAPSFSTMLCGMPNAPGGSCRAVVIHSPPNDLMRREERGSECALISQLHIFFNVMTDLFGFRASKPHA